MLKCMQFCRWMKHLDTGVPTGTSLNRMYQYYFYWYYYRYLWYQNIIHLHSVGNGSWESEGTTIVSNMTDGNTTSVQCLSTHLTSFAVLIDVGGGLQVCLVTLLEG